jgi:hypothetical protein
MWDGVSYKAITPADIDWVQLRKNLGIACYECGKEPVSHNIYVKVLVPIGDGRALEDWQVSHGLCDECNAKTKTQ